jgi:polynucleotide kinase-phosphatase
VSATLQIPELCLVALVGPTGCGKSTFARAHFLPTEIISSDYCRGLVSDDENDQGATNDAFEVLHYLAGKRLTRGRLTVIDATNVQPEARKPIVELARRHHVFAVAIVLDMPESLCRDRNRQRPDRDFGDHVIRNQRLALQRSIRGLEREGFRYVHVFRSPAQLDGLTIQRQPLWNNRRHQHGPFDIIGDVHGCFDELVQLLERLGYAVERHAAEIRVVPPAGRMAVFVGDLVDRGPAIADVLRLVQGMVEAGTAQCVAGNHEAKLLRALRGRNVKVSHGLAQSLAQLEGESTEFRERVAAFLDSLVSHYVFDDGRLVVAHAGLKEELQGRSSGAVREFAMYGETTGEIDEFGLPVRHNWAGDYRGRATVVYGHTPMPEAEWLNNTICVDTGCVFGGRLTALRYPERELVSVPAARVYFEPVRPLATTAPEQLTAQQAHDEVLDLADVVGKRIVDTRLRRNVVVREENAAAALEVMSRFAADPRWLIYLPPTMSPCETCPEGEWLEHPREALAYYAENGVERVLCEEKHMGSRTVLIVCRDTDVARRRFGVTDGSAGIVYTRTGRPFFSDAAMETGLLRSVREAFDRSDLWARLHTDWACLDCELMPWSAKAQDLLRNQYAAVGAAAQDALSQVEGLLRQAQDAGPEVAKLLATTQARRTAAVRYVDAYRRYCWKVNGLADIKLAPFHLLAWEGRTGFEKTHAWHMQTLAELAAAAPQNLIATPSRAVDLPDENSRREAVDWWLTLTESGGEGFVVKPMDFVARGPHGLVQPAVKCRGREYLRIIYGPEYTDSANLERLRRRGLSAKRSLAAREFALGVEALERFVAREPLRRVHECVFGVLALESEPVDPRL